MAAVKRASRLFHSVIAKSAAERGDAAAMFVVVWAKSKMSSLFLGGAIEGVGRAVFRRDSARHVAQRSNGRAKTPKRRITPLRFVLHCARETGT
jgi:hypothetical protein